MKVMSGEPQDFLEGHIVPIFSIAIALDIRVV